ncbi:MAG: MarR family transcriptional regulator [Clostridia bacterium]|nr:MarR family transcriptional regulator [Clostridia bacterium]
MDKFDSLKLKNQLCFPIYLCSKEIISRYTPKLNKLNLTYTQYIVMLFLWEHNEVSVSEIGKALFLDSNTLSPLLKKLEEKGYVVRSKNAKDARNLIISLTKTGKELKSKALFVPKEMGSCINLSNKEAATLYSLVYKVLNNVEKEKK